MTYLREVFVSVVTLKLLGFLNTKLPSCLVQKGVGHESAAHTDSPVDAPYRKHYPGVFKSGAPDKYMLVATVDQCAIEIEEKGLLLTQRVLFVHSYTISPTVADNKSGYL
jgi:hypothetical protein